MMYRLSVEWILRDQFHKQEYTAHISVDPAPLTDSNEASVTVAIIVTMIVLVVIVTVIVYAFKTGRWCFAASRDYTATGTESRVDEEHPDDIVEQKEGNHSHNRNSLQLPRCADNQETMELQSFLETPISNLLTPRDDERQLGEETAVAPRSELAFGRTCELATVPPEVEPEKRLPRHRSLDLAGAGRLPQNIKNITRII